MNVEPNEFEKALELLDSASISLARNYTPNESPRKEIIAYLRKYPINNIKAEPLDKNVEGVREQLKRRAEHGLAKYGVTTERKDVNLLGWLQHLQEELMDASVYIERLKSELIHDDKPVYRINDCCNPFYIERQASDGKWATVGGFFYEKESAQRWIDEQNAG